MVAVSGGAPGVSEPFVMSVVWLPEKKMRLAMIIPMYVEDVPATCTSAFGEYSAPL